MARVYGEVESRMPLESFAQLLGAGPWTVNLGRHAVRLTGPGGAAKFEPTSDGFILADGIEADDALSGANELSGHLAALGLRHRFEVYDDETLVAYLHHQWPAGSQ